MARKQDWQRISAQPCAHKGPADLSSVNVSESTMVVQAVGQNSFFQYIEMEYLGSGPIRCEYLYEGTIGHL